MNDIELKEFDEMLLVIDRLVQEKSQVNANIVRREIRKWIEGKKEEWQLRAFHDGYQTRCDEDEMTNRPMRTEKAIKAIQHKAEMYQKIIKLGIFQK
jgi:hypothetical protein